MFVQANMHFQKKKKGEGWKEYRMKEGTKKGKKENKEKRKKGKEGKEGWMKGKKEEKTINNLIC